MITCPLCNKNCTDFHKKSHILPEWMFKNSYNTNHKIWHANIENETIKNEQKGHYDEIICPDCEKASQLYDSYSSRILTDNARDTKEYKVIDKKEIQLEGNSTIYKYHEWENIDFPKFQHFIFICILRAYFSEKNKGKSILNDKHFEKIRNIYNNVKITDDNSYPIMVFEHPDFGYKNNIVCLPFATKLDNHRVIKFTGGNYSFWVFVSSRRKLDHVYSACLKSSGHLIVLSLPFRRSGTFKAIIPTISKLFKNK